MNEGSKREMQFKIVIFIFVVNWATDNTVLLNGDQWEKIYLFIEWSSYLEYKFYC